MPPRGNVWAGRTAAIWIIPSEQSLQAIPRLTARTGLHMRQLS